MNADDSLGTHTDSGTSPRANPERQAIHSLRGYAYQALAATLAWFDLDERSRLYLEIAEDYAVIAKKVLDAVQVKDTRASGSITLNSESVRKAIANYVDLCEQNPALQVHLHFFTTSNIGTEQAIADRPAGMAGLRYWQKVATGADPHPLRKILESDKFPEPVRRFTRTRENAALLCDLIRKIHWDTAQPDYHSLRDELEARLIVVCRDRFRLPAPEARQLSDPLVYRVLEASMSTSLSQRVLTRAKLYHAIDNATLISMPRASIEAALSKSSSALTESFTQVSADSSITLASTEASWLTDGASLPSQQGLISRKSAQRLATHALVNEGAAILFGGSGIGKSTVSRAVVTARADPHFVVDFRDVQPVEARRRLEFIVARLGQLPASCLILEDLNCLDDKRVVLALARLIDASRRRYRTLISTCYVKPAPTTLAELGLDHHCVVDCPYFSEDEARALVSNYGGDPDIWGRLAYLSGASGHPQLTHAFVAGTAAREWPVGEIETIITRGLSSAETDATRDTVRRSLVSRLPEGTRVLLYRLSLTLGPFNRSLALALGAIPPSLSQIGESLDRLVGPWIQAIGDDRYRISPLATKFGSEMLQKAEQTRIHKMVAEHMLANGTIDAGDLNAIVAHAISGRSTDSLMIITRIVLSTRTEELETLANNVPIFGVFRTDAPIYPQDASVSRLLRLTQFTLVAATKDTKETTKVAAALFKEIRAMSQGTPKQMFEELAISIVLGTKGVANYLDDWLPQLSRFRTMSQDNEFLQQRAASVERGMAEPGANFWAMLFSTGIAELDSVDRLEHVVNSLHELDASERALFLTPIHESYSDYSSFVNGPWAAERHLDSFDPTVTAMRYKRMSNRIRTWNIRPLYLQCLVAQAIMLDEYLDEWKAALDLLEDALSALGDDVILWRAKAKVHWHHREHKAALDIFKRISPEAKLYDPVDRAFALREAAICAAECRDWLQAMDWFVEAQSAAAEANSDNMQAMAIGLGADTAVAAFKVGQIEFALTLLSRAVTALADLDPDKTLSAASCHRVVRHTILWLRSRINPNISAPDDNLITMRPGACSNPEPLPAIRELPLAHIDLAWYMLAEAEALSGLDAGVRARLNSHLALGPIPTMEIILRLSTLQTDIDNLDSTSFASNFATYLESAAYLSKNKDLLKANLDTLSPERGRIPVLDLHVPFDRNTKHAMDEALFAFVIRSAVTRRPQAIDELHAALNDHFPDLSLDSPILEYLAEESTLRTDLEQSILKIIENINGRPNLEPADLFLAGARFFEWSSNSRFQQPLMSRIAAWQRSCWETILKNQLFRIYRPRHTVPQINDALSVETNDSYFLAKLFTATSDAVGATLRDTYRDFLASFENASRT